MPSWDEAEVSSSWRASRLKLWRFLEALWSVFAKDHIERGGMEKRWGRDGGKGRKSLPFPLILLPSSLSLLLLYVCVIHFHFFYSLLTNTCLLLITPIWIISYMNTLSLVDSYLYIHRYIDRYIHRYIYTYIRTHIHI